MIDSKLKKHNFSAGPAILPKEVFEEAAQSVLDFNNSGLSLLEISHRSADFSHVMEEAQQLVREIGGFDDSYAVLFLTGGASSQFYMAPMNILHDDAKAAYVDTGSWSSKAIKEARHFGQIDVVASSKDKNYTYIPKDYKVPEDATYLHLTSNNTIYGSQYHWLPDTEVPFICDMSSDMFSRPIDTARYGLIYAGAQKNLGPAGVTLVIVKKDWIGKAPRPIPTMLDYKTHEAKGSMFNTPPAFPIYVLMLTLRWIKANGGLNGMEKHNREKAALLYNEIDENPCFTGTVQTEDRSLMNATFVPTEEAYQAPFLELCKEAGINGIKGHRSVGGFRASMYNAMSKQSVEVLVDVMRAFAQKHG